MLYAFGPIPRGDAGSSSSIKQIYNPQIFSTHWLHLLMEHLTSGQARELRTSHYLSLIYFTVLFYDYLLTFSAEVHFFWSRRRMSWPSVLFFLNRYGALLGHIPYMIGEFMHPSNEEVCSEIHRFYQIYVGLLQLVIFGLYVIRVSAIYNNSKLVVGYLVVVIVGSIALCCWFIASDARQGAHLLRGPGVTGCPQVYTHSQGTRPALPWTGVLLFDSSIFVLTTAKAFRIGRQYPRSIISVLLRDGTLCFIVLFLVNLANILTCLFAAPLLKSTNTLITTVMSNVAMSRMMLDLRAADEELKLGDTGEIDYV
ncbi:hypothetical protein DENSPDRAFT_280649 [Dentipellis sp. KUC8613]|nr:hypothetical protein DENSPDRAFT_280649 [Dentipellis sp. KUC8613]